MCLERNRANSIWLSHIHKSVRSFKKTCFFNCSTHNLKNSRNAVKDSPTFRMESASLSLREPTSLGGSMVRKLSTTWSMLEKRQAHRGRFASDVQLYILTIGNSWASAWQSARCIRIQFLNKHCIVLMVSESGTSFWILGVTTGVRQLATVMMLPSLPTFCVAVPPSSWIYERQDSMLASNDADRRSPGWKSKLHMLEYLVAGSR